MILFHGTMEEHIKSIKKSGLQNRTHDQWLVELVGQNVLCLSNEPTSGEGGSPIYFAGRQAKAKNANGYLVVVSIPQKVLRAKLICVLDNKILDDYVRYHFFVREEYRQVGYPLFLALQNWKANPVHVSFDEQKLISSPVSIEVESLASKDQRTYYRDLGIKPQTYTILGIPVSDLFIQFIKHIGSLERFYHFLELHYAYIAAGLFEKFQIRCAPLDHAMYWKEFYAQFLQPIFDLRDAHIREWFSSHWLFARKSSEIYRNCQILLSSVEPEFIVGFIHVTNGSSIVPAFRPRKPGDAPKYTMAKRIWREVNRMLEK